MKHLNNASIIPGLLFLFSVSQAYSQSIGSVHHQAIVIDTHTDTPMNLIDEGFNVSERHEAPDFRVDFPRLREGDVDAVFFALYTGQRKLTRENYDHAYDMVNMMLDSTLKVIERNKNMVQLAVSSDDIVRLSRQNKIAICLGMENGFPIAKDLSRVNEFYNKGVRYITLCHTSDNDICDSSTEEIEKEDHGLSEFGKEVVKEMNRLGMMIDVSHLSDRSFYDVISLSSAPVIASHSSVRALCNHPRNMSDDMIKALANKGGVIQICILGDYIVPEDTNSVNFRKLRELKIKYNNWQYKDDLERKRAWHEYDSINKYFPPVLPFVEDAVNHIDHVVRVAGIDYVGIGSDFDGGGGLADCVDVSQYQVITAELLKRGYSADDIFKIWGGNFLRVFKQVEKQKGLYAVGCRL